MPTVTVIGGDDAIAYPRAPLNDATLSFTTRGLYAYLYTRPEGWRIRFADLANKGNISLRAVKRAIKELEDAGYIYRERINLGTGKFDWDYQIFPTPKQNPHAQNNPDHNNQTNNPESQPILQDAQLRDWLLDRNIPQPQTDYQLQILKEPTTILWIAATSQFLGYETYQHIATEFADRNIKQYSISTLQKAIQKVKLQNPHTKNIYWMIDYYQKYLADPDWTPTRNSKRRNAHASRKYSNGQTREINPDTSPTAEDQRWWQQTQGQLQLLDKPK